MKIKKFLIRFFILSLIISSIFLVYGVTAYSAENMVQDNDIKQEVLEKINKIRIENNLTPLTLRSDLSELAKLKAEDFIANNYISHNSKKYGSIFDMLKANEINYNIAGENLAGVQTTEQAINGWMNSESHRDNILEERYQFTRIYVINSNTYGKIFVQVFLG